MKSEMDNTVAHLFSRPAYELTLNKGMSVIDKKMALRIAAKDAAKMYRDLSPYRVSAELKDGNWRVDYELKDPSFVGGGPHYLISGETGNIMLYRYEQ